jgi:hypothetical protein
MVHEWNAIVLRYGDGFIVWSGNYLLLLWVVRRKGMGLYLVMKGINPEVRCIMLDGLEL